MIKPKIKKSKAEDTNVGWIKFKIEDVPKVKKLRRTVKFKQSKPLQFCFSIAGMEYSVKNIKEGKKLFEEIKVGEFVDVIHERENKYDEYACAIYYKGKKLGYIPRDQNQEIVKLSLNNKTFSFIINTAVDFEDFYDSYKRPQILAICY